MADRAHVTAMAGCRARLAALVALLAALTVCSFGASPAGAQDEPPDEATTTAVETLAPTADEAEAETDTVPAETEEAPSATVTVTETETETEPVAGETPAPEGGTTTGVRPGAAAVIGAAAAEEDEDTDWGWVAFGILAGAMLIGGIAWLVRRRSSASRRRRRIFPRSFPHRG